MITIIQVIQLFLFEITGFLIISQTQDITRFFSLNFQIPCYMSTIYTVMYDLTYMKT